MSKKIKLVQLNDNKSEPVKQNKENRINTKENIDYEVSTLSSDTETKEIVNTTSQKIHTINLDSEIYNDNVNDAIRLKKHTNIIIIIFNFYFIILFYRIYSIHFNTNCAKLVVSI